MGFMISFTRLVMSGLLLLVLQVGIAYSSSQCGDRGIALQVLGSGGPEMTDQRASTAYLVWQDGRARVLIDMGPGSLLQFEKSGARLEDLDVILLSHLHVDHSADLPALIKGSFFTGRNRNLPLYGPTGNQVMPNTEAFVQTLFASPDGAFHYLDTFVSEFGAYRLQARNVEASGDTPTTVIDDERFRLTAIPVNHGPIPALAWRIDIGGKSMVISGDMNGDNETLEKLADQADLLVAHHAIPEGLQGVARNLHMPPSVIGKIAATARVHRLVLSHRMLRTIDQEAVSTGQIRKHYSGPLDFAEDGHCYTLD